MHRFLLHNTEIRGTTEVLLSPGQVGFMNGWGVFSTIRVSDGILFAFQRHYARMERDSRLMRVPMPFSADQLEAHLRRLVEANRAPDSTLRVAVVRNKGNLFESPHIATEADLIAFTAPLNDWGAGVKLTYVKDARHAASPFAGTKVTSWGQNLVWHELAHERGFDEAILLNEHGQVSECTSANIFAIYGNQVFTPPLNSSGCLPGITRALLLEEIATSPFTIAERDITPDELKSADQVFITSTTRDVLPVLEVDHRPLRQRPEAIDRLRTALLEFRSSYVDAHRKPQEVLTQ